ncbi:MAG: response regulator transcription factor [Armatimonadetes bacterium]|nr:response regulator transcription factor [Armatimonadota bacterium]MDI9585415.1 response regulator transcription factor [Acidobacteriota bacterium]
MPDKDKVLVIDDSPSDRDLAGTLLRREGYEVTEAETGERGLELIELDQPNIVLLDVMLPGIDGLEVCRRLRQRHEIPVLMLTARDDEVDKVVGLELGADDYVAKPFAPRELVARVRALLRRSVLTERATAQKKRISYPGIEIDMPTRSVLVEGEAVHLTPKEFDLLFHLASRPRRVFTREEIVEDVWGYSPPGGDLRTVDTHVKRLRKKLEEGRDVPWSLATVWGVGYKFEIGE